MKPYANLNGKAKWFLSWGRAALQKKFKKIFKKSARRQELLEINEGLLHHETKYDKTHEDFFKNN